VNEVFFDYERMLSEYSLHLGIKTGEEIIDERNALKGNSSSVVRSIESIIEESFKNVEESIANVADPTFTSLIDEIESSWNKSFIINCVPNVLNGNYVNVPVGYVKLDKLDKEYLDFSNNEAFFFDYLERYPLRITKVKIDDMLYYNITNVTIVPTFITLNKEYYLSREI
jgi:hypothetical protein